MKDYVHLKVRQADYKEILSSLEGEIFDRIKEAADVGDGLQIRHESLMITSESLEKSQGRMFLAGLFVSCFVGTILHSLGLIQ